MAARKYEELVPEEEEEEGLEAEDLETAGGPKAPRHVEAMGSMFPCCCCCCCLIGIWVVCWISASIFAPPEPRSAPGNVIWEPVLPSNFSVCTLDYYMLWEMQEVLPPGIAAGSCWEGDRGQALGEWRQGWSFGSMYFYYVRPTPSGEEQTMIHAQSVWRFFGQEFRLWRGDIEDAPVLTLSQDWWGQPWFAWEKVRIFDVLQDTLYVARMTETVTPTWVGYGGATIEIFPPQAGEAAGVERPGLLGKMTQPGVFWLLYFAPPPWQIENFAPSDIPSGVPGFYSMISDITEQQQATGPIFWIVFVCWVLSSAAKGENK